MNTAKISYRPLPLVLALLMLLTSANFAVDIHYCQGKIKSFSLWGKAKSCHQLATAKTPKRLHHTPSATTSATTHRCCSVSKKNCCENKTFFVQYDSDQKPQNPDPVVIPHLQQFLAAWVMAFFTDRFIAHKAPVFAHYQPPLIPKDLPVLVQSFLL